MSQDILLHGGPCHGKLLALPDGVNLLRVLDAIPADAEDPDDEVELRAGTYSRVLYSKTDFEWDGWKNG